LLRSARTILAHARLRRLLLVGWLAPMFAVVPEALAAPYVAAHHGSPILVGWWLVGWWLVALPVGLVGSDVAGVRLLTPRQQRRLVAPVAAAGFVPYLAFAFDPPSPSRSPAVSASVQPSRLLRSDRRPRRRHVQSSGCRDPTHIS